MYGDITNFAILVILLLGKYARFTVSRCPAPCHLLLILSYRIFGPIPGCCIKHCSILSGHLTKRTLSFFCCGRQRAFLLNAFLSASAVSGHRSNNSGPDFVIEGITSMYGCQKKAFKSLWQKGQQLPDFGTHGALWEDIQKT